MDENKKRWKKAYREKCQGRRNAITQATPPWLNDEQKAQLHEIYVAAKEINKLGNGIFHVDHIVPLNHPLVCGLHVPWNLQVINAEDNRKKGNDIHLEPLKGAITVDCLGGSLRYKGKFLKGYSGNKSGRPTTVEKHMDRPDPEFELFMEDLREIDDPEEVFLRLSLWSIKHARSREELQKNAKDFGPYIKPRLANKESDDGESKEFNIKIIRTTDDRGANESKPNVH